MKFIAQLVLIAGLGYVAEQFFPWWIVAVCAFGVNVVLPTRGVNAFLSGFLGVGLLWLVSAAIIDQRTDSLLTEKVAGIMLLNNAFWLVALAGLIGGVVGGMAALTGSLLRNLRHSEDTKDSYYRQ